MEVGVLGGLEIGASGVGVDGVYWLLKRGYPWIAHSQGAVVTLTKSGISG